jgi:Flp pilus assembly protein TadG
MFSWIRNFIRARCGNVAVTFAITVLPITAGIGGAIDFARSSSVAVEMQTAIDSGVLAAASLSQARDPEDVVRAYIEAAIQDYGGVIESLQVTVDSDTSFNSRRVLATANVKIPTMLLGVAGIEYIYVQRQAEAFEQLMDIEIALVLDISSSMRGSKIDDLREASIDFVNAVLDDDNRDYTSVSIIPYGGTVKLPASFFSYVDTDASLAQNAADWNGCLELPASHVDRVALDTGGYDDTPEFTVWNRGNNWCPPDEEAASIFLSNNPTDLIDLLSTFDNPILSDGTGTDVATGWGMRALDPAWRGKLGGDFPDRPTDYTDRETLKVLVVMTDGGITQQRRPEPWWEEGESDPHVGTGGTDDFYNKNTARQNFRDACDYAKDNNVAVYTIAFQVSGSSNRALMEECASTASGYYNVANTDIGAAFSSIAGEINQLRLSQ